MASSNQPKMVTDNSLPKTIDAQSQSIQDLAQSKSQTISRNDRAATDSYVSKEISYEDDFDEANDQSKQSSLKPADSHPVETNKAEVQVQNISKDQSSQEYSNFSTPTPSAQQISSKVNMISQNNGSISTL